MDELDVRVDVIGPAVPVVAARSATWPSVRVTHVPTGTVVVRTGPHVGVVRREALEALAETVDGQVGKSSSSA